MTKKYELLSNDTVTIKGNKLFRIKALIDIALHDVKVGDIGGYVQSEENLYHGGACWVGWNAKVFDNAKVTYDAIVCGEAEVFDNAHVSGNALVCGKAKVTGKAMVYDYAMVSGNAQLTDNTRVYGKSAVGGNAIVSNGAIVSGNSLVSGDAKVAGNAIVSSDSIVSGNAILTKLGDHIQVGPAKSSGRFTTAHLDEKIGVRVTTGCFTGSVVEFLQSIESSHKNNPEALKQYRAFHQLIVSNFNDIA